MSSNTKINVGIVGYGNLGKSLEKILLLENKYNLVAIFSRRNVISKFNTLVEPYNAIVNYKGKIDVMLLAGGSKSDLEFQTPEVLEYFDSINTFDNHKKIDDELKKLNDLAKASGKRSIICAGWDPGVFSIIRAMFKAIGKNKPITFWGKGISMGHSEAIRQVDGVVDAVQFTIPNPEAKKLAKTGFLSKDVPISLRKCFVYSNEKNTDKIAKKIKNIPDYFKGQPVSVEFVSLEKILRLKRKLSHKGEIIEVFESPIGSKAKMNFSVNMQSNPDFTASIVIAYISAIINLKETGQSGAFTPLDIPMKYLFRGKAQEEIYKTLC